MVPIIGTVKACSRLEPLLCCPEHLLSTCRVTAPYSRTLDVFVQHSQGQVSELLCERSTAYPPQPTKHANVFATATAPARVMRTRILEFRQHGEDLMQGRRRSPGSVPPPRDTPCPRAYRKRVSNHCKSSIGNLHDRATYASSALQRYGRSPVNVRVDVCNIELPAVLRCINDGRDE